MRLSDRENPGRSMGSSFAVRSKLDEGSVFAIVLTNAIATKLTAKRSGGRPFLHHHQDLDTVRCTRIVMPHTYATHSGFTQPLTIALPTLTYGLSKNSSIAASPLACNAPITRRLKLGVVSSLT